MLTPESVSLIVEKDRGFLDTLGYPESALGVQRFLQTSNLADTPLGHQLQFLNWKEDPEMLRFGAKEIIAKIRDLFFENPIEVIAEKKSRLSFLCYQLHVPRVSGAEGKMTIKSNLARKSGTKAVILGFGGGPSFTLKMGIEDTISSPNCIGVTCTIDCDTEICELISNQKRQQFYRLKEISQSVREIKLENLEIDKCALFGDDPLPSSTQVIDLSKQTEAVFRRKFTTEEGAGWKAQATLSIPDLTTEIGVEYEIERTATVDYDYSLPAGRIYTARLGEGGTTWIWQTDRS